MSVIFSLIFEVIKITIQSGIYTSIVIIVVHFFTTYRKGSWLTGILKNWHSLIPTWFVSTFAIGVALFVFSFSYWGDHGLGDLDRIPIGYERDVKQIDGTDGFIETSKSGQIVIKEFVVHRNFLFAKTYQADSGDYIVWNLKTDDYKYFNRSDYFDSVKSDRYPSLEKFKNFNDTYFEYWYPWRFLLLP